MKKKLFITLMCMSGLAIVMACGGGNASKNQAEAPADGDAVEQQADATSTEKAAENEVGSNSTLSIDDFSAQLKEACGQEPIINEKMTRITVRKDKENEFFMASPVAEDIDGEAVQREYFNAFAKVADGNKIYGLHMDGTRGNDVFKDYDEYVNFILANGDYAKVNYGYDYKGKKISVNCFAAFGDFGLTVTVE